jgi:hypothetical protein
MTLRRIALKLIGAFTLGALPATAGMLSFNAPDNNVSTTASTTEGGLTTVAVCGYTYARFGATGESWQHVDVAGLIRDLGIADLAGGEGAGGNGGTTNAGSADGAVSSSGGSAWNSSSDGSGWGNPLGNGTGFGGGAGTFFDRKNSAGGSFDGLGGPRHPSGPFGPFGPFDPPWWRPNHGSFPWGDKWDHGDDDAPTQHTPEPATLMLLGGGLLASRLVRRRQR